MSVSLTVTPAIARRLRELASLEIETGAVLLAIVNTAENGSLRLLGTSLIDVPEDAYELRGPFELRVLSHGYVPALAQAEHLQAVPIWLHTHPGDGSDTGMSRHDDVVNSQLSDLFRLRAESDYYGALVIGHEHGALTFTGHLDDGEVTQPIDRLVMPGDRIEVAHNSDSDTFEGRGALFDRNIRAFGGGVQDAISHLRFAVVGCGGTGSAVAEQLIRLGVRKIDLYDPDELSLSNVTRVYGSTPNQVGDLKVDVAKAHLLAIAPDAEISTFPSVITDPHVAQNLAHADVVFGCTDDNAGRLVLSRLPTYALSILIDCGVLLSSNADGTLSGIDGRVTVVSPESACLLCRGRIDVRRAAAERMTPEEHATRFREGYAPALAGVEPAVVAYTTVVAAIAVSELIERLVHFGTDPVPGEVLLRLHERELSTNRAEPKTQHYCDPAAGKIGAIRATPFLEMTW